MLLSVDLHYPVLPSTDRNVRPAFAYRRKDQVHLLDMISVWLVDENWLDGLSPVLQSRLQELLDDPEV